MPFCAQCGGAVEHRDRFCGACGTARVEDSTGASSSPNDLDQMVARADAAYDRGAFAEAAQLYRICSGMCSEAVGAALGAAKVAKGVGWVTAFLTGGIGIEDLFIVPAVSALVGKMLGISPEELGGLCRMLAVAELDAMSRCELLDKDDDEYILRQFALIYSAADNDLTLHAFANLYLPLDATGLPPETRDRHALETTILSRIPWMQQCEPQVNQLLLRFAKARGWKAILQAMGGTDSGPSRSAAGAPTSLHEAYELLGVSPNATLDEIRRAYHSKVSKWHPDKLGDVAQELRDYATAQMARLNAAYELLRGTHRRSASAAQ